MYYIIIVQVVLTCVLFMTTVQIYGIIILNCPSGNIYFGIKKNFLQHTINARKPR